MKSVLFFILFLPIQAFAGSNIDGTAGWKLGDVVDANVFEEKCEQDTFRHSDARCSVYIDEIGKTVATIICNVKSKLSDRMVILCTTPYSKRVYSILEWVGSLQPYEHIALKKSLSEKYGTFTKKSADFHTITMGRRVLNFYNTPMGEHISVYDKDLWDVAGEEMKSEPPKGQSIAKQKAKPAEAPKPKEKDVDKKPLNGIANGIMGVFGSEKKK